MEQFDLNKAREMFRGVPSVYDLMEIRRYEVKKPSKEVITLVFRFEGNL